LSLQESPLNGWQKTVLLALRFSLGWHFFYQGFGKLVNPYWSAGGYLNVSWGPFKMIGDTPWMLTVANYATMLGLVLIGTLLMVGLFTRTAAVCGALLLTMIFAAVPPLNYTGFVVSTAQGSELYVDKNLIEILGLVIVASFRTGHIMGLDILVSHWWRNRR